MDKIAQRICALAFFAFGIAAIIFSSNPAQANSPTQTYATGKYQMQFNTIFDNKTENQCWYILVWDTETGRSKMYYGNTSMKKITSASDPYNLPSSPL